MEKKYRVKTNINKDTVLHVDMKQDFEMMDILTMSMSQENAYRIHSSNYGVIVGRVLANDAFGIPNAKISVFIQKEDGEDNEISSIYPYSTTSSKDKEGRRYNILPNEGDDDCYRVVGTFPNKTYLLDNDIQLEIYDKYWKYTTVTNQAGDYMLFGVPVGNQQIHIDIDLSDIGILSQKPRDFEYKGYNITNFDNASQFKSSTNLDNLVQIFSQGKTVYVYPFWGDTDDGIVAITRADIQIQYKFEPTCVFIGSVISDNSSNEIGHRCTPSTFNGYNEQLIAGEGTIEMIRKTNDGLTEEFQIQGNRLIDSDGVFCYQIPMNLDYVGTDEYGNIVPTNNPSKGIPTRTRVRFRFSKQETGEEGFSRHTAKYLVPNNPELLNGEEYMSPTVSNGKDLSEYFEFGSSTPDNCFRDMYLNKVYSVKNYIPRIQTARRNTSKHYSGIKATNIVKNLSPMPFNTLRFDLHFTYMVLCTIIGILVGIISALNTVLVVLIDYILVVRVPIINVKLFDLSFLFPFGCISFGAGLAGDGVIAYYPGCNCGAKNHKACDKAKCPDSIPNCKKESENHDMMDSIQQNLGSEYEIAKTDFYNDWINGSLYMPLWRWRKRKKKSFLFGLFHSRAKNEYCSCSTFYKRLKLTNACDLTYNSPKGQNVSKGNTLRPLDNVYSDRMHKMNTIVWLSGGIIQNVQNREGLDIYYYTPGIPRDKINNINEILTPIPYVRLYATDIILLGSLDDNDLHGIPQLFKYLPSTTSNIPPIATVSESHDEDDEREDKDINDTAVEDVGTYVTTGMDWGHRGENNGGVAYRNGLFMDLKCTSIASIPKSCINAERMCELGISNDMLYRAQYGANENTWGEFLPDGMITKLEIDNYEIRAMFATLNHIGFIPNKDNYVMDENTGYYFNKFKYLYPVNFDGKMQSSIDRFLKRNEFKQGEHDNFDKAYMEFRYGSDKPSLWHFYHNDSSKVKFPLYNNSFYFYFGIKTGHTALDKFNKLFHAECVSDKKFAFSANVTVKPLSSCPVKPEDFAYIIIDVNGIATPYSYEVYNYNGDLIGDMNEELMDRYIGIGCEVKDDGTPIFSKQSGFYGGVLLKNKTYKIKITDANGRTIIKNVSLNNEALGLNYENSELGGKYKFTPSTKEDEAEKLKESSQINKGSKTYIISNQLYGSINIQSFMIDGDEYVLTNKSDVELLDSMPDDVQTAFEDNITKDNVCYKITLKHYVDDKNDNIKIKTIYLSIVPIRGHANANLTYKDVTSETTPNYINFTPRDYIVNYLDKKGINKSFNVNNVLTIDFNTFYPDDYKIGIYQECVSNYVSKIEDETHIKYSSYFTTVTIENGQSFDILINQVPLRTLLGDHELITGSITYSSRGSKFYTEDGLIPLDKKGYIDVERHNDIGWLNAFDPGVYQYPVSDEDWGTYISITDDKKINNLNKIKFILDNTFHLLNTVMFTDVSNKVLSIETVGGKKPVKVLTLSPMYEDDEDFRDDSIINNYALGEIYSIAFAKSLPNIVADNYNGNSENKDKAFTGKLNPHIGGNEYSGNYIAAFTKNGGVIQNSRGNMLSFTNYQSVPAMSYPFNGKYTDSPNISSNTDYITQDERVWAVDNKHGGRAVQTFGSTRPFFRFMTVDMRLDYDLVFVTPSMYESDGVINGSKDWQKGFLSGTIYNGIALNYDKKTRSLIEKQSNPRNPGNLEYRYDDYGRVAWRGATKKSNRRFYEVLINGEDKTDEFARDNNESFPKVYPAKNEFQINDIKGSDFKMTIASCSYDMAPELVTPENGEPYIDLKAKRGEECNFSGNFNAIATPIIGGDEKTNFTMMFRVPNGKGGTTEFWKNNLTVGFSKNSINVNDYSVYPMLPFVLKINEETYQKVKNSKEGIKKLIEQYDLESIEDIYLLYPWLVNNSNREKIEAERRRWIAQRGIYSEKIKCFNIANNNKIKYNAPTHSFITNNNKDVIPLTLNDNELLATQFNCDWKFGNGIFTIVTPLKYKEDKDNFIKRCAEIYSFSDPIDTRNFEVTFLFVDNYKKLQIKIRPKGNVSLQYKEGISYDVRYYTMDLTTVTETLSDYVHLEPQNTHSTISMVLENEDVPKIIRTRTFYLYITLPNGYVFKVYADNLQD